MDTGASYGRILGLLRAEPPCQSYCSNAEVHMSSDDYVSRYGCVVGTLCALLQDSASCHDEAVQAVKAMQ